ncbi:hypothetical protein GE300_22400 [Rhodobacteraceae bacterium 2CG4]|uniref:Haem-binding uptake Tiki superfamily ChaN domain-containing protein n=1 Tax=Halovulum marinum TaxID=2662447 RepID=A0A6L5Z860_9RHOB|nr:hypothetical protein [Halovulum marinum]
MSVAAAIDRARAADVVFVGEVHDNPAHHEAQAAFARALSPRAIVFEMIPPEGEAQVAAHRDDPARLAEALDWADSGWPDFAWYHAIIAAAPDAAILGAHVPRARARAAMTGGAAAAFGDGAAAFGLDRPLPAEGQQAREARQAAAHCDLLPAALLPGMVEVQRLRDARLAQAALRGSRAPGAGPVLVITGNGHAETGWGAPAALAAAAPELALFSYAQFEAAPDAPVPFDGWRVTAPAAREEPCDALR